MTKFIQSGMAKLRIEECATKKQGRIDSGTDTIVGVNKYRLQQDEEEKVDVLQIDNSKVRELQTKRLEELKSSRDEKEVETALKCLEESASLSRNTSTGDDQQNLLKLSLDAARVRCTIGEISLALEKAWGRHVPTSQVVQGAYGASFYKPNSEENDANNKEYKDVLDRVSDFLEQTGRRPRILVAKMGQDGHDRGAKVIASGFSDLGFDVDVGPLFQTPSEVAMQAIDSDVHVIGISSQAAGHRTLLPKLKEELERHQAGHMKVVAGGVIPPVDYNFLINETKSCSAVFGPGTRITDAAHCVLDLLSEVPRDRVANAES
mmetsp:Transcript_34048/g.52237  ORF Transcript_34048/g.52237 Transcript_34048/m.52237 type:complete len:320 (+) Transcript_34048:3-962(+)